MTKDKEKETVPPHIIWLNNFYGTTKCKHDWRYEGHGHNYNVYKCAKCGLEGEY